MSHYGTPPPDEDDQAGQEQPPPGSHAAEPAAYNPYPDNWDAPQTGSESFTAHAPGDPPSPYAQDPYAQDPYAQDPYAPNPYAPNPYGQQGPVVPNPYTSTASPDKPTFGFGGYAGWFTRVGAYLIDYILASVAGAPLWVGEVMRLQDTHFVHNPDGTLTTQTTGTSPGAGFLILVGALTMLAFVVWNAGFRQGRTGASIGKSVLAVRLVNSDLQPIGPGWALLRQLLHILDGLPCACLPLGFLWPIWDDRKQTFADKIVRSFVIQAVEIQPRPFRG